MCGGCEGRQPAQCQPPAPEPPQRAEIRETEVRTPLWLLRLVWGDQLLLSKTNAVAAKPNQGVPHGPQPTPPSQCAGKLIPFSFHIRTGRRYLPAVWTCCLQHPLHSPPILWSCTSPPIFPCPGPASSLCPYSWLPARAGNLTLPALEQFQGPVIAHCEADKSSGHLTIQNILPCTFFFSFSFWNKLPELETDIEQCAVALQLFKKKYKTFAKKYYFFGIAAWSMILILMFSM